MKQTPVLYLDIDGTVRHGYDELGRFVNGPEDVVVFPEAVERMREWKNSGGRIIGVTNQGGIALGHMNFYRCDAALNETNRQTGWLLDKIQVCPHHPSVSGVCLCRKPSPTMLHWAVGNLQERYGHGDWYMALMVGDRPEDEECAEAAGVHFLGAQDWRDGKGLLDL